MEAIKKFVIIGPESTGKSTLSHHLAAHYNTLWVPEYAREFLLKNGTDYTYPALLKIAHGQLELEEKVVASAQEISAGLIFIDTDMYVMKVWCEYVFNECYSWILNRISERAYDGYLLCDTDIPWVKDELREYPDLKTRKRLFHHYRDILINQSVPWVEIKGNEESRINMAVEFVEGELIGNGNRVN